jgi:hypothetical protein
MIMHLLTDEQQQNCVLHAKYSRKLGTTTLSKVNAMVTVQVDTEGDEIL